MIGFDLLTASLGLAASALTAALLLPLWRRAPVPAYRLAVSILAAALALPLLQAGARALDLPVPHPVRDLARSFTGDASRTLSGPAAEPLELWLTPEELEGLALDTSALPERPLPAAAAGLADVPWERVLVALWAAGALWALGRTLLRLRATHRLFAAATPVRDAALLATWERARGGSRIGARTRLFESHQVRTPACSGLVRPVIVLPAEAGLERRPELLACVLTHELVHLERRDPWVMVGEELLRAAFWFHPAAWWLVARLGALRELSCDSLVVRRTGSAKRYASALVEYASWMQRPAAPATWAAVVPWSESRGHLTRRIEMLLQSKNSPRSGRVAASAAVGVLMTFLWSGQLALATSSCAGAPAEHDHPHGHAAAEAHTVHTAHNAHDAGEHEVHVVKHDGKRIVLETKGEGKEPVVWRVHGDDRDSVTSESHVVVLQKDGGERTVYTGEDAVRWLAENDAKVNVHHLEGKGTKQRWIEEIQGAWRDADGDHEVFVFGGSAAAAGKSKSKSWSWSSTDSDDAAEGDQRFEVIVGGQDGTHVKRLHGAQSKTFFHGESKGEGGPQRMRVLLRSGDDENERWIEIDGKELRIDGKRLQLDGKKFELDFSKGSKGDLRFGGDDEAFSGKAHNVFPHGELPELDKVFERESKAGSDLDQLRRELEETRAALEQQREMLEKLKRELEKQREARHTTDWAR